MSENFYRVLHFASLFFFFATLGVSFFSAQNSKASKIISGVASLLIFVAGMGLIAKGLEIGHGASWPKWLHAKITIWAILAIGAPIINKRFSKIKVAAFYSFLVLATIAAYIAVNKPF